MSIVVGTLLAALVATLISNDARRWAARGVRIGRFGPTGWFWISFLLLIVGGPWYLYQRWVATSPGGARRRVAPPGWHPDPDDPKTLRWWDGSRWTEHTAQVDLPPPPEP